MDFKIRNGGPVITLAPETRFQVVLQPTHKMWVGQYIIMSLIGYERCATCMGRIHIGGPTIVEGHTMVSYECLACHTGCAKVTDPDGVETNYDCFAQRGTILPYVCARRPHTELVRPYFPHNGLEANYFGVRWSGDLYTALAPLGLYILKYTCSDMNVHNRIGGHLSMVRVAGPMPTGCYTHSNWLILNTDNINVTGTTIGDWDGLRRRLSLAEYTAFEPSLRLGIDVVNEMARIRRGDGVSTATAVRNEFRAVLRAIGLTTKVYKADPAWRAKVEATLAGFGDVKKLLK